MAFESKETEIKKALKTENTQPTIGKTIDIPVYNDNKPNEKTKLYTFTLQPSVRKKLDIVAKEHNYRSTSKFLNELIKNFD